MSKCKDCKYAEDSNYRISNIECCTCSLTRRVMNANAESNCNCFNRDLSGYDICYNCKYYIGGGDWGLFCSHKDMYHHLGKFSDAPCKRYERRAEDKFAKPTDESAQIVPNEDLISRKSAIDAIMGEYPDAHYPDWYASKIRALPSAQPERKTGYWIPVTHSRGGHECNRCHDYAPSYQNGDEYLANYCPNCGAYMKGATFT